MSMSAAHLKHHKCSRQQHCSPSGTSCVAAAATAAAAAVAATVRYRACRHQTRVMLGTKRTELPLRLMLPACLLPVTTATNDASGRHIRARKGMRREKVENMDF